MLDAITLGIIQGISEWLPVSSEGLITLVQVNFNAEAFSLLEIIRLALFLHLGTFFAALVYFHKDVRMLIKKLFTYKNTPPHERTILNFLIVSTFTSGLVGILLLKTIEGTEDFIVPSANILNIIIGSLLLVTAYLLLGKKDSSGPVKTEEGLNRFDGILLGVVQGFAALPGLSRSGLTVSTLLLRGFDDHVALRLSFLMSLPVVLGGNILLNAHFLSFDPEKIVGLFASFIFGLLTIHVLLTFARKVNMGYFVLFFAVLLFLSVMFV